nr:DUF6537 domain-containing protein [Nocardioides alcanivorans]
MKRKITLGPWFAPVFVLLAKMRFLRGTPFDVFGHMLLRRIERALVDDYVALSTGAVKTLDASPTTRWSRCSGCPPTSAATRTSRCAICVRTWTAAVKLR